MGFSCLTSWGITTALGLETKAIRVEGMLGQPHCRILCPVARLCGLRIVHDDDNDDASILDYICKLKSYSDEVVDVICC